MTTRERAAQRYCDGAPLVMVGDTRSRQLVARLEELGWGRVVVDCKPAPYAGEPWVLDNGAFVAWREGKAFGSQRFLENVRRAMAEVAEPPLFAVLPDMVAEGTDSLWWSVEWASHLPLRWNWYLAVQDGMEPDDVSEVLSQFCDGIFLGGTDPWKKKTAAMWCDLAHSHGKPFHYGRAGTLNKLNHATRIGADSLDSAFPLWTLERFDAFVAEWFGLSPQLLLALAA